MEEKGEGGGGGGGGENKEFQLATIDKYRKKEIKKEKKVYAVLQIMSCSDNSKFINFSLSSN